MQKYNDNNNNNKATTITRSKVKFEYYGKLKRKLCEAQAQHIRHSHRALYHLMLLYNFFVVVDVSLNILYVVRGVIAITREFDRRLLKNRLAYTTAYMHRGQGKKVNCLAPTVRALLNNNENRQKRNFAPSKRVA